MPTTNKNKTVQLPVRRTFKMMNPPHVGKSHDLVVDDLNKLIIQGHRFGCIYADPPWQYQRAPRGAASRHYSTMSMDELLALPVSELASEQAHLHLWTTHSFMREGIQLMEAWGFSYKSMFVWVKHQLGTGYYWRGAAEYLLLGVKGQCRFREHRHRNWLLADRNKHSAKPFYVRNLIERVSPGPFLELFGREAIQGWAVFGNEVDTSKMCRRKQTDEWLFKQ